MSAVECSSCGGIIGADKNFCTKCGAARNQRASMRVNAPKVRSPSPTKEKPYQPKPRPVSSYIATPLSTATATDLTSTTEKKTFSMKCQTCGASISSITKSCFRCGDNNFYSSTSPNMDEKSSNSKTEIESSNNIVVAEEKSKSDDSLPSSKSMITTSIVPQVVQLPISPPIEEEKEEKSTPIEKIVDEPSPVVNLSPVIETSPISVEITPISIVSEPSSSSSSEDESTPEPPQSEVDIIKNRFLLDLIQRRMARDASKSSIPIIPVIEEPKKEEPKEEEEESKKEEEEESKEEEEEIKKKELKEKEHKEREHKELKEKEHKEREHKEKEHKEKEHKELKEKEHKEREHKEKEHKEKELQEKELKEQEHKEREHKELKEKEHKEKELKEKEHKEREHKEKEHKEKELQEKELKEQEHKEKEHKEIKETLPVVIETPIVVAEPHNVVIENKLNEEEEEKEKKKKQLELKAIEDLHKVDEAKISNNVPKIDQSVNNEELKVKEEPVKSNMIEEVTVVRNRSESTEKLEKKSKKEKRKSEKIKTPVKSKDSEEFRERSSRRNTIDERAFGSLRASLDAATATSEMEDRERIDKGYDTDSLSKGHMKKLKEKEKEKEKKQRRSSSKIEKTPEEIKNGSISERIGSTNLRVTAEEATSPTKIDRKNKSNSSTSLGSITGRSRRSTYDAGKALLKVNDNPDRRLAFTCRMLRLLGEQVELKEDHVFNLLALVKTNHVTPPTSKAFLMTQAQRTALHLAQIEIQQFLENQATLDKIVKVQSLIRRYLIHSKFKKYNKEYVDKVFVRNMIFSELILNERGFIEETFELIYSYMQPLARNATEFRTNPILKVTDAAAIFANIEDICKFHSEFLDSLEALKIKWPFIDGIGKKISNHVSRLLRPYSAYVTNYKFATDLLSRLLGTDEKLRDFCAETQGKYKGKELIQLLSLPLNRMSTYAAFVDKLIRATPQDLEDVSVLSDASIVLENACNFVDENLTEATNYLNLLNIQRKITGLTGLYVPRRSLILEGNVIELRPSRLTTKQSKRHLFVFNDIILFTKVQKNQFKFIANVEMDDIVLHHFSKVAFEIGSNSKDVTHKIAFPTQEEKNVWYLEIQELAARRKRREVFGKSIDELLKEAGQGPDEVPIFIKSCIERLSTNHSTEGLFRISGPAEELKKAKEVLSAGQQLSLDTISVHVVATLLKLFLRDLSEPVIPFTCYDLIISSFKNLPKDTPIEKKKDLIFTIFKASPIPMSSFRVLKMIIEMLKEVLKSSDKNLMKVNALGTIFGSLLLRPKAETIESSMYIPLINSACEIIIEHFNEIFPN